MKVKLILTSLLATVFLLSSQSFAKPVTIYFHAQQNFSTAITPYVYKSNYNSVLSASKIPAYSRRSHITIDAQHNERLIFGATIRGKNHDCFAHHVVSANTRTINVYLEPMRYGDKYLHCTPQ